MGTREWYCSGTMGAHRCACNHTKVCTSLIHVHLCKTMSENGCCCAAVFNALGPLSRKTHVFMPDATVAFQWRRKATGPCTVWFSCMLKNPRWLKLSRALHYGISHHPSHSDTLNITRQPTNNAWMHQGYEERKKALQLCLQVTHIVHDNVIASLFTSWHVFSSSYNKPVNVKPGNNHREMHVEIE